MNDRHDPDRNLESELRAALDEEAQRARLARPEWGDQPYVAQDETRAGRGRSSAVVGAAAAAVPVAALAFAVVASDDPGTDSQSAAADVETDPVEPEEADADEEGGSSPDPTIESADSTDAHVCQGTAGEAIAVSPDGSTVALDGPIDGAAPGGRRQRKRRTAPCAYQPEDDPGVLGLRDVVPGARPQWCDPGGGPGRARL